MKQAEIERKYKIDIDSFINYLWQTKRSYSINFLGQLEVPDDEIDESVYFYLADKFGISDSRTIEFAERHPDIASNYLTMQEIRKRDEMERMRLEEEKMHLEQEQMRLEQEQLHLEKEKMRKACAQMLISSGFSFEGYRIVKYSGYISGDDAVQIPRSGVFGGHNGSNLTNALVQIRRQALKELKEAAYHLGCNAVIGVDFDYITIEPETANITGGTLYEPYVICVTANGNAVVIEKIEE